MLLPQHLHNFLIQLNQFEDKWKFSITSDLLVINDGLSNLLAIMDKMNKRMDDINERLEKLEKQR